MIVCDTSGLLALLDEGEPDHARVREAVGEARGPRVTIDYVLAEIDYLLVKRLGLAAEQKFLGQVQGGALLREPVGNADFDRAIEIARAYGDLELGLTDAAVMAVAERLQAPVLTLDRRHFTPFRDRRGRPLALLP